MTLENQATDLENPSPNPRRRHPTCLFCISSRNGLIIWTAVAIIMRIWMFLLILVLPNYAATLFTNIDWEDIAVIVVVSVGYLFILIASCVFTCVMTKIALGVSSVICLLDLILMSVELSEIAKKWEASNEKEVDNGAIAGLFVLHVVWWLLGFYYTIVVAQVFFEARAVQEGKGYLGFAEEVRASLKGLNGKRQRISSVDRKIREKPEPDL